MRKVVICLVWCCLAWQAAKAQQPLVLRGEVRHLNGEVAANTPIRLLEPNVAGATGVDGMFSIQLPSGWSVGDQVTLLVRGYEVIRPWEGKITIRRESQENLEPILIARSELANVVRNTAELERILLAASIRDDQPSELDKFREEARRLNTTLDEFLALFNAWKEHAEYGTLYEQALAALYEKKYGDAIALLDADIAGDEKDLARLDSLRALMPRKYVNLGIAHAGKYEHAEAEAAYKRALVYDSTYSAARLLLADMYQFTGRLAEAIVIYRTEARRYDARTDSVGVSIKALVLQRIGSINKTWGRLDSALVYHRRSLAIERQLNRSEGIAADLGNIGNVYYTMGRLDSALVYHRLSLAIERQLNRLEGIAATLGNIGNVYQTQGKLDSALVYLQQALEINRQLSRPEGIAAALNNIGNVYQTQGKLDSTLAYYRVSLAVDHHLNRPEGIAATLGNIGVVYYTMGRLDSALVYHRRSLFIERQLNRPEGIAIQLSNISLVYQTQGRLDSALVYHRRSLAIERQLNRPEGMGISHLSIGLLYAGQGENTTAIAHLDSALVLFTDMGSPRTRNAQIALLRLKDPFFQGHILFSNQRYAEALAAYREALQAYPDSLQGYQFIVGVFEELGQPDSVAATYRQALARDPDHATSLNNLAWHFALRDENLDEALELSQRSVEVEPEEGSYWDTLAEVYLRRGQLAEAEAANEKARQYARGEGLIESINERAARIANPSQE